jgi:hypothetical protein
LQGCHAIKLTKSYRMIAIIHREQEVIQMLDIGSHDEVY